MSTTTDVTPAEDSLSDEALQAALTRARTEHAAYRDRVRERAIQGFVDGFFSLESLNATLTELGLAPFEPKYATEMRFDTGWLVQTPDGPVPQALRNNNADLTTAIREAITRVLAEHTDGKVKLVDGDYWVTFGVPERTMER